MQYPYARHVPRPSVALITRACLQIGRRVPRRYVEKRLAELLDADPWLPASWPTTPSHEQLHGATEPLDTLLQRFTAELTVMPGVVRSRGGGGEPEAMMMDTFSMDMADDAPPQMMMARAEPMMRTSAAPMAMARVAPKMAMATSAESVSADAMDARSAKRASFGSGGGDGGGAGEKVKVRSAFETTPLFLPSVHVGPGGTTTVQWTLPDNSGAYELRAYAARASDGGLGGGATATQFVRKHVTLDASAPRVARVGDTFRCGVTATGSPELPSASTFVATIALQRQLTSGVPWSSPTNAIVGVGSDNAGITSPISLTGATRQPFQLGPSQSSELVFEMRADAIGEATLVVTVLPTDGAAHDVTMDPAASDAIALTVPVLGVQPAIKIATSMALRATGEQARIWPEALQLPQALAGSGSVTIGATVGRLASVRAIATVLQSLPRWDDQPSAPALLGAVAASAMLAPYHLAMQRVAGRAPSFGGGEPGSSLAAEMESAAATTGRAVAALATMTSVSGGLHYSARASESAASWSSAGGESVDLHLNALGLLVLRRLATSGVATALGSARWQELGALGNMWRAALDHGLTRVATESIDHHGSWRDPEMLAFCRLALGTGWQPNAASSRSAVRAALSLDALAEQVDSLSVFGRASYALALLLPPDPLSDDASAAVSSSPPTPALDPRVIAILRYLAMSLRVSARSAYIARTAASRDAASSRGMALALSALSVASASGQAPREVVANLDKLANHVAMGQTAGVTGASLVDGIALADYDHASLSLAARVHVRALLTHPDVQAIKLFDAELTSSGSAADGGAPSTRTMAWSALRMASPPPPLIFSASGVGEASIALSLDFVPADLPAEAVYRGIDVAKIVRLFEADEAAGPPLRSIPVGRVVTVTLQLTTADEITNLVVEDWLPAGLEPIDPHLATSSAGADQPHQKMPPLPWWRMGSCMWWWRCTEWVRETKKDSVSFYAPWAHAGTHTLSFEAVAVTRGSFALPPTQAHAAMEPELMGLSKAGHLTVAPADSEPLPLSTPSMPLSRRPMSCPDGCSGRGTCDIATGRCTCEAGASGRDCSLDQSAPHLGAVNVNNTLALPLVSGGSTVVTPDDVISSPQYLNHHVIPIPVSCPRRTKPRAAEGSSEPDAGDASPPPPPDPETPTDGDEHGPRNARDIKYLLAFSSDEERLPSSALSLTAASGSHLELAVQLPLSQTDPPSTSPPPSCVHITLAASFDGIVFGSRVIALWLSSTTEARSPEDRLPTPGECVGDGVGYSSDAWGRGGALPPSMLNGMGHHLWNPPVVLVGFLGAVASVAVWRLLRPTVEITGGMKRLSNLPEPAESPGSQSGCHGGVLPEPEDGSVGSSAEPEESERMIVEGHAMPMDMPVFRASGSGGSSSRSKYDQLKD